LESWKTKLYLTLSFLKGYLVLFMMKQDSISTLNLLSSQSLIWVGLSSNQTRSEGQSWWCFYLWFSLEYLIISFGLTNTFALFLQHMSPLSWSI
jgi:hypothetical protein